MNSFYMGPPVPNSRPMRWRPYKHPITTHCSPPTPMLLLPRLWLVWWFTECILANILAAWLGDIHPPLHNVFSIDSLDQGRVSCILQVRWYLLIPCSGVPRWPASISRPSPDPNPGPGQVPTLLVISLLTILTPTLLPGLTLLGGDLFSKRMNTMIHSLWLILLSKISKTTKMSPCCRTVRPPGPGRGWPLAAGAGHRLPRRLPGLAGGQQPRDQRVQDAQPRVQGARAAADTSHPYR